MSHSSYAKIDLEALRHNVKLLISKTKTPALAVVKADAYGHGAIACAKAALSAGCSYLGVATENEALELRMAGIEAPILMFGLAEPEFLSELIQNDITLTLGRLDQLELLNIQAEKLSKSVKVHVKLDTGLSRLGFEPENALSVFQQVQKYKYIILEGVYTHLAMADSLQDKQQSFSLHQMNLFAKAVELLKQHGFDIPLIHCAASSACLNYEQSYFNMVRLGISMYGYFPSKELASFYTEFNLRPVMSLHSKIVSIHEFEVGRLISYGGEFVCNRPSKIAVAPLGYADGLRRNLLGQAQALIQGQKAFVVGKICMDMCMLDVTHIPQAKLGDELIFFGSFDKYGQNCPQLDDLAAHSQTISYELLCGISKRIPRIYEGV